ncbi:DUF4234 domain-containing protein [Actinopolymorpha rutila]|uniref:DUF4234 domain-containing protein n=1 Tax=Actinopolymorpha rutila TaxID=446787 RepID=A0A852ZGW5_9ACTN|nr:hypothetical protein [Actinopolymorpha rutila]
MGVRAATRRSSVPRHAVRWLPPPEERDQRCRSTCEQGIGDRVAFTSSQSEQLVVEQGDGLTRSQGELAVAQGAAVAQPIAYGLQMKRRRPWGAYGLMWLTLGVYHLVWWYKIHNEMNQFDPRQQIKPITSLAAQFFGISTLVDRCTWRPDRSGAAVHRPTGQRIRWTWTAPVLPAGDARRLLPVGDQQGHRRVQGCAGRRARSAVPVMKRGLSVRRPWGQRGRAGSASATRLDDGLSDGSVDHGKWTRQRALEVGSGQTPHLRGDGPRRQPGGLERVRRPWRQGAPDDSDVQRLAARIAPGAPVVELGSSRAETFLWGRWMGPPTGPRIWCCGSTRSMFPAAGS